MSIHWRPVCGDRNPGFLIKGRVLSVAKRGDCSRFLIEEYRIYSDGVANRAYRVRDAEAVSDAEIRQGKSSPVVACFDSDFEAIAFCDKAT